MAMMRKILAPFLTDLKRTVSPPEPYWRSLHYFNLYRLIVSGFFVVSFLVLDRIPVYGADDPRLFFGVSVVYVFFAILMAIAVRVRWPAFIMQLSVQSIGDAAFIVLLMHASGGVKSGIGMLLVVSLAASSLISKGRQAMFFAAVAAIAVLLEQSFRLFVLDVKEDYFQAAMLGMGFFATAGLGYYLAKQVVASERLVEQKSIDLENLAQVNELVIHEMQDGVLVVDGIGRVRTHNARCEGLLGPPPRIWSDLRLNDYAPALAERMTRWNNDRNTIFPPMRVRVTGKEVSTRFSPIDAGSDVGAVIFLEDVSLQQAQAQQIKLAALGRLTANIAHEIRNPLSAIGHATQLLQEEEHDKTEVRLLQIIRDNTLRLDRIVQDVLQLNRRDRAQRETIQPEVFLRAFIEQICLAEKIPARGISLEMESAQAICFDRAHLHQVLWNLCVNAWRHSRQAEGSIRIYVSAAHLENVVQIDVIDDGPGVDKALVAQLFEPFFTTFSGGTGLGLYIAREICEANGASLDYIEVAPGGQFRICCKGGSC
ncbi:two-component sensor histidine kinase [Sulfurimicrobium lacus]|uniref:histidine kinase n=2 Tax=Sulfurimicrobium lacus TaxID=2715678 RepID=A0A6F8VE17_9PROT|nr:two-component sensor histidine kinase [Sulfurimicrobium lacus]